MVSPTMSAHFSIHPKLPRSSRSLTIFAGRAGRATALVAS